jgi:hypothetical protein
MVEPSLTHEGNLRLAGFPLTGYPEDPVTLGQRLRTILDEQDIDPYGPVSVWFAGSPEHEGPDRWEGLVAVACTGFPRPQAGMLVEDYRRLSALSLPHHGPITDLPRTWRRLMDHGQSLGHRLRPYWRLSLRARRLSDGNLLPMADVSVFLDR